MDVYAPCPCGSGKKFKFCCHNVQAQIEPALRLLDNDQVPAARAALEKLQAQHPRSLWVLGELAELALQEERWADATALGERMLAVQPGHPHALAVKLLAHVYDPGCEALDWALVDDTLPAVTEPLLKANLCSALMTWTALQGSLIAAYPYYVLALGLDAQHAPERLQELRAVVSQHELSYHDSTFYEPLKLPPLGAEAESAWLRARGGTPRAALALYERLAASFPEHAGLRYNIGVCRARMLDDLGAVADLHRAAELESDFDTAVEYETLAQVLEARRPEMQRSYRLQFAQFGSVGRLLTLLDAQPRFFRELSVRERPGDPRVAHYRVLEHPLPAGGTTSLETAPFVLGGVTVFHGSPETDLPGYLVVFQTRNVEGADVLTLVKEAAPEEVSDWAPPADIVSRPDRQLPFTQAVLLEEDRLFTGRPKLETSRLERKRVEHVLFEVWPNTPNPHLRGLTPREASQDPQHRVRLAAALAVLFDIGQHHGYLSDLATFRSKFRLPAPEPWHVADDVSLLGLSVDRLLRVPLHEVTDAQLREASFAASLSRCASLLYDTTVESVSRFSEQLPDRGQALLSLLARLAYSFGRREECFAWHEKQRQVLAKLPDSAFMRVQLDMLELSQRADDPLDPQIPQITQRLWQFAHKVPEFKETLVQLLEQLELPIPAAIQVGMEAVGAPLVGSVSGTSGLWTPESAAPAAGPSKLWVPGQD